MQKEHTEIRKLIGAVNQFQDPMLLEDFANALSSHIRFEERTYFPHLEVYLSDEKMTDIGNKLSQIHQKEQDDYPDEFWK